MKHLGELKIRETTFGEFYKKFSGLATIKYPREDYKISYGGLLPVTFRVSTVYNKDKDCTLISITPVGYITICGPKADSRTIVVKAMFKVTEEDLKNEEFLKQMKPVFEELYNWYKES